MSRIRRQLLIYAVSRDAEHTFEVISDNTYVGKTFYCVAKYDDEQVFGTWSLTAGSEYASINENGRVTINPGVQNQSITIQCTYVTGGNTLVATKQMTISYDNQLTIDCPSEMSGTSGNAVARYNTGIVTPTWSIISGSSYAQIDTGGTITILDTGDITIQAVYTGYTTTKEVSVIYVSNVTTTTEVDNNGNVTTITTVTTENQDGSVTESTTATTTNEDGSVSNTESELTTNQDGSSTYSATTTNQDGSSSQSTVNTNADGSSSGNTTNYDENGDPTSATNNVTDSDGNSSTQSIEYNESGDPMVTGYEIDTDNSEDGYKEFNGNGINTDYYAFDMTHGFVLDFNFTIDFSNQPPNQNENHHNILTMKRANPSPWYGFQLRQSGTNKYIILGTQFDLGSNTNTQLNPVALSGTVAEYNLKITYDPLATGTTFTCRNLISNTNVYTSSSLFPDIEELRYLKVTIGYAMDPNGDPYRYSNINVKNFSIRRLTRVADPVISCDGQQVSITCSSTGSTIYYRFNEYGNYTAYTNSVSITADTVVEAYAVVGNETGNTVMQTCYYDNGIERPEIYCDGEVVTIDCGTPSVDIYYRLNQTGDFSAYTEAIEITADTVVEAYAELNGETSSTVLENCVYNPIVMVNPVISCNGSVVTITCATQGATIYYRLNQDGAYSAYTEPIAITADTVVEAYAQLSGHLSGVAMETCEYNPVHDYSQDYLTFRILTGGTVVWKAFGTGYTKTIEYNLNDGGWTSITASTTPPSITVQAHDYIKFRGTNTTYAGNKSNYDGFAGGTAVFDIEGNIMSLISGDNFTGNTTLTGTYAFCSMFKQTNVVSAENLILPATTLTNYCYRAMFSKATTLEVPPQLPATSLSRGCYYYMFEDCAITTAPDLVAPTIPQEGYYCMFTGCTNLNFIRCLATSTGATSATTNWVSGVAATGTFVKESNTTWSTGASAIPTGWVVANEGAVLCVEPEISCDGEYVTITCPTTGADIYYRLGGSGSYSLYTAPVEITANTMVQAYGELNGQPSVTVAQNCEYVSSVPIEYSNRDLDSWVYNSQNVQVPYSINAIDGHSSAYQKGTFNFETSFVLRETQPAYLLFQHADQSASIYIDNTLVEKHWGGYNAFYTDISNHVHSGSNVVKVAIKNNEGSNLAPAAGDFNFNATLGKVKLLTSPVLPDVGYGYDGFHITSTVTGNTATINIKTKVPNGADVKCEIDDGTYYFSGTQQSDGTEMTFTTTISGANLRLWNGTKDPHLYTVSIEISSGGTLYHRFERDYGIRYFDYVFNETVMVDGVSTPNYTGFLLNGEAYLLRGVCMHHDIEGKANALTDTDIANDFAVIQELGCNFIRLAHYPHPKEVYDWCDRLGIIVQTEAPCVNKMQTTMPQSYYDNLVTQYDEMVRHHYNHPSIIFWGLSNETTTDDKAFAKQKIEDYTAEIKAIDPSRMVGYVISHNFNDPYGYYNSPTGIDWVGANIYVGWYINKASNNPSSELDTRINNTITNKTMALAFSEYGCGGTQHCHSEDPQTTTTTGNYARHDIEYQMWLHEGHIAAIRNYPQLLFTGQWQLFDIAVSSRNEGYTICLDGENTSIDDNLRRLNNKGLVERDHVTRKDTFYVYKAEWNDNDKFVHICGKDYTRYADRVIKCYTNDGNTLSMSVNGGTPVTTPVVNHIAEFTRQTFGSTDTIVVSGATTSDTFTFGS